MRTSLCEAVVVGNQTEAIEGSAVITLSDEGTSLPCATRDRNVLEALYNATGGPNWPNNTNWLSSLPLSDWHGVTVDSNGCVAVLTLSDNQLTGSIPAQLGNLTNLQDLRLFSNQLTGTIPVELGNLANLSWLELSSNQLTGSIPSSLGNLSDLRTLSLHTNQLTGAIPASLGNLANLEHLSLRNNQLTGTIPAELGNLAVLLRLWLENNQLTGTIPSSFTGLGALSQFYFYLNPGLCAQDSGPVRIWLNTVSDVRGPDCTPTVRLSVTPSHLIEGVGATPVTVTAQRTAVNSPTDVRLILGGSAEQGAAQDYTFSGSGDITIPANATSGTTTLTLTPLADALAEGVENIILEARVGSQVEGSAVITLSDVGTSIPCVVSRDRAALEALYNATGGANWTNRMNWLDSSLPLSDWHGVTVDGNGCVTGLDLTDNQLTGTIPSELSNLAKLERLWLGENQLTGAIPAELSNLASLEWLSLSFNQLTGTIPVELGNLASLRVLVLHDNQLTGSVPVELGNLASLEVLILSDNRLTGTIPVELENLAVKLERLDLDDNQLTGSIPCRVGQPCQPSGTVARQQPTDGRHTSGVGQPRQSADSPVAGQRTNREHPCRVGQTRQPSGAVSLRQPTDGYSP